MKILDETGHRSYQWSAGDPASVAQATERFVGLKAEGRIPFAVDPPGEAPVQVREFDPRLATDLIWLRPIRGG